VLPATLACAAESFDCLALIKPQFEVGREHVGSSGVVRSPEQRRRALAEVGLEAKRLGTSVLRYESSGLPGPKGNRETFVWLAEAARGGLAEEELEPAARDVEP
jgi:23S rRNA (cytidine1920-2'-O)/16S rRNA (cytidine1409-2'-O)-methyltransferase